MAYNTKEKRAHQDKLYRKNNLEKIKEKKKQHYLANRQEILKKRKEYYTKTKIEVGKRNSLYRRSKKKTLVALFGGICTICKGIFHPAAYDFHHLNPKEKDFNIALNLNYEDCLEELKKCILVCSNCHRELHATPEDLN